MVHVSESKQNQISTIRNERSTSTSADIFTGKERFLNQGLHWISMCSVVSLIWGTNSSFRFTRWDHSESDGLHFARGPIQSGYIHGRTSSKYDLQKMDGLLSESTAVRDYPCCQDKPNKYVSLRPYHCLILRLCNMQ